MEKLTIIGDIHGKFEEYYIPITSKLENPSIQVGDMCIGFTGYVFPDTPIQHKFIHGNHDNPDACIPIKNYLGRYGYLEKEDIFFISGAFSVDKDQRTPGFDYWYNEELNYKESLYALELYKKANPRIVISHDCPSSAKYEFLKHGRTMVDSMTNQLLEEMLINSQPSYWFFGHHHVSKKFKVFNYPTQFQCLAEAETITIEY